LPEVSNIDETSHGVIANCGHKLKELREYTLIYRSGYNVLAKISHRQNYKHAGTFQNMVRLYKHPLPKNDSVPQAFFAQKLQFLKG
jgi:hypothetical protein